MKQTKDEVVLFDSPEAASIKTVKGWVSRNGRFCGADERMARYDGCTHTKCKCGNITERSSIMCNDCWYKERMEIYNKLPFKEWDFKEPVCTWDGDKYFFSVEALDWYMEDNDIEEIKLLFCEENNWQNIEADHWADMMPEDGDGELPKEMQEALDTLNKVISSLPPQSYSPAKIRTAYKIENETNLQEVQCTKGDEQQELQQEQK